MAIRQAIWGAVEQAPTRVLSTAWVDHNGRLHETTVYNTDAEVKGVRVLAYINNGQETRDQEAARLASSVNLPHYLKKNPDAADCKPQAPRQRMPIRLDYKLRTGTGELDAAVVASLGQEMQNVQAGLTDLSNRWYAQGSDFSASEQVQSAYWTSLLGSAHETSDWQLQVRIERMNPDDVGHAGGVAKTSEFVRTLIDLREPEVWLLDLRLLKSGQAPVWQFQSKLENVLSENAHASAGVLKVLKEQFVQAVRELDQATACVPIQYTLKPLGATHAPSWVLTAGEQSRLKVGDRLLVLDRQSVPARMLEPKTMERVALAEVVRVGARQTELRQLAGAPLPRQGDWVAMPL